MKRLDKAILLHSMIEEFEVMLQNLVCKLGLKDYFRYIRDTGSAELSKTDEEQIEAMKKRLEGEITIDCKPLSCNLCTSGLPHENDVIF